MEFRRMREEDLEQVAEIEQSIFSMPWKKEDFLESLNNPSNVYIVASENTTIYGYCGMWGVLEEGQINNVAVRKDFQGKGIGFQMVQFLLEEGYKQGLENFTLEVRESNQSAIHIYEKAGFESAGIRKNFYEKPRENAVIMWKSSC